MRRVLALALFFAALAVPTARAAVTSTVGAAGPVRAMVRTGDVVWLGGSFGLIAVDRDGTQRLDIAPSVDGTVYGLSVVQGMVYAAGIFTSWNDNLIAFDGRTGTPDEGFLPAVGRLRSVLATPAGIWAGGGTLYAWNPDGAPLAGWVPPVATVNQRQHSHTIIAAFRDLAPTSDGRIVAACQCDAIDGNRRQGLAMFDPSGALVGDWPGPLAYHYGAAFGIGVRLRAGTAFVAFGGSDSVEAWDLGTGRRTWYTDVSGSAQALALRSDELWVGGHFRRVADDKGEHCYHPTDADCYFSPRLAVLDVSTGVVRKGRRPSVCCRYNGVWTLLADTGAMWIGGDFAMIGTGWWADEIEPRSPQPVANVARWDVAP